MGNVIAFAAGVAAGVFVARGLLSLPEVQRFWRERIIAAEPGEDTAFGGDDVRRVTPPSGNVPDLPQKRDETAFSSRTPYI